jgi:RNA polymerase sigma factor (sigma-70 family)
MRSPESKTQNREYSYSASLYISVQEFLRKNNLAQNYEIDDILKEIYKLHDDSEALGNVSPNKIYSLEETCPKAIENLRKTQNKKQFDKAIQALFDGRNPESMAFCASITRTLRQFRLSGTYDAREIISEAYARSIVKIEEGVFIQIPLAWLRRTCFNVIRDFKRQQTKIDKPKLDGEVFSMGEVAIDQILLSEDLKTIRSAFEKLNPEDQNILQARIFQGLSWQEISDRLCSANELSIKPGTARQRGSRALTKLRQQYKLLRNDVQLLPADNGVK